VSELPEDAGFTPPLFSDEQTRAIIDFIETHGRARARTQGSDFSEADYLAGAMSLFFIMHLQNKLPASWIFTTWRGESPLGVSTPDREVYVVVAGKLRQPMAVYADRHVAQEHVEQLWRQGDENAFVATEPARTKLEPKIAARIEAYYAEGETSL